MPFLLKDVILKEDESDWLLNQQSTANSCTNSDISFHFRKNYQPIPCTDATIGQVSKMKPNQRMNMSGTLNIVFGRPET